MLLTAQELEILLSDLESDRVERKRNLTSHPDNIRQAICAFANDLPNYGLAGVIFVGVEDNGACSNISVSDILLRSLADLRSILPFPVIAVQKHVFNGCEVAVVQVEPSYNPPVRYNGRAWIRLGPRRATATAEEERRLSEKQRSSNLPFDQQVVVGASVEDDLDLTLFQMRYLPAAIASDILEENERTLTQQLTSLRFLTKAGLPNHAAILVLGKEPQNWLSGAYIQFLRIDGTELTDAILHQQILNGALPTMIDQLDDLLNANIVISTDITSQNIETQQPDYPIMALQQLSRNALLHRTYDSTNSPTRIYWYSDRIEIMSPGGPYGNVTLDNFGQPGITDYRNPLLAEAMRSLGYVQRFGMGIVLANKYLQKNNNPSVEFKVAPSLINAIVRKRV